MILIKPIFYKITGRQPFETQGLFYIGNIILCNIQHTTSKYNIRISLKNIGNRSIFNFKQTETNIIKNYDIYLTKDGKNIFDVKIAK